jgi:hypothetical protein
MTHGHFDASAGGGRVDEFDIAIQSYAIGASDDV